MRPNSPPSPLSPTPTTPIDPLPLSLRAGFTQPCWLAQHCVRHAPPASRPAMPPADQLRYASHTAQFPQTAPASFINAISGIILGPEPSSVAIECLADGLGDTALCLDIGLCRGSCLRMEEQHPPRRCHHLRRRLHCLVLASLWTRCRRHDSRRRRVSVPTR